MKPLIILSLLLIIGLSGFSQKKNEVEIYNPEADAMVDIKKAIEMAAEQNKHVLIQVGGNWCGWCKKLHALYSSDPMMDSIIKADYILTMVNYSKENKNPEAMTFLEYPHRFGFPVFVVLDGTGKRLHTQSSAYFESKKDYDWNKIMLFLTNWNYKAVSPDTYK